MSSFLFSQNLSLPNSKTSNSNKLYDDHNYKNKYFIEQYQICNFSFSLVEKLDDMLNKSQLDQIDSFFEDFRYLSLFLNYFSGFLSIEEIEKNQDVLVNVLSYLLFKNLNTLQSFIPLAINLLVGGTKKLYKPTKIQRMISLRYFLQYFDVQWFYFKYSDSEFFLISTFKNMSPLEDPGYYLFLNKITETIPPNSRFISNIIETLFNSSSNSPLQFKYVDILARKSPRNLPYYSILFYIKNCVNGIYTRISHHYLIPLIIDFYNENELSRLAIWHYICRLVQFCITVQCLKKQRRMLNENMEAPNKLVSVSLQQRPSSLPISSLIESQDELNIRLSQFSSRNIKTHLSNTNTDEGDNASSLSEDSSRSSSASLISEAFNDLDCYDDQVMYIIDLLHILYALHIPLLCRTIYMEIRCAQLSFNFFKKQKFDESYVILTVEEIQKSQYIELPLDIMKEIQNDKSISKSNLGNIIQRKKEIYYIQHYLYDKQLLKDFHGVRPREINLKKLLDFPVSGIPLKKGVEKSKTIPSSAKQNSKQSFFACSPLSSSLSGISIAKKNEVVKTIQKNQTQNNEIIGRSSPVIRLRQFFSRESKSASAE